MPLTVHRRPSRCHCATRAIDFNLIHTPFVRCRECAKSSRCARTSPTARSKDDERTEFRTNISIYIQQTFFVCHFFFTELLNIQYNILVMSWQHIIRYSNFLMDSTVNTHTQQRLQKKPISARMQPSQAMQAIHVRCVNSHFSGSDIFDSAHVSCFLDEKKKHE